MSLDVSVYISLVQISLSDSDCGDELESTDDSYRDMETGSETEVSLIIVVL